MGSDSRKMAERVGVGGEDVREGQARQERLCDQASYHFGHLRLILWGTRVISAEHTPPGQVYTRGQRVGVFIYQVSPVIFLGRCGINSSSLPASSRCWPSFCLCRERQVYVGSGFQPVDMGAWRAWEGGIHGTCCEPSLVTDNFCVS